MKLFFQRIDLFASNRLWWALSGIIVCFILAYPFPELFFPSKLLFMLLLFLILLDILLLIYVKTPITAKRITYNKWSNSDENKVLLEIENFAPMAWKLKLIDELPFELQKRNYFIQSRIKSNDSISLGYKVRPVKRGKYSFGKIRVFISTPLSLFSRRISVNAEQEVAVYPSLLQMKQYALYSSSRLSMHYGIKKTRRIGQSYEFEMIKDYVQGDDLRHVNWRATGRTQSLKTNHFIEEKSQPVYCVIDKSRTMNMAFDGLTLLDYAINSALVISNTALKKGDRAGLITFSDKIGTAIRADNGPGVLRKIVDNLYFQKYRTTEADFEFLFTAIGRVANTRSLLFLYTNFESIYAMERALPVLRKINNHHLLVLIIFENAELTNYAYEKADSIAEIHNKMVAKQMVADKRQMVSEMAKHGILCMLSKPKDLTINSLNQYLMLKAKGLI